MVATYRGDLFMGAGKCFLLSTMFACLLIAPGCVIKPTPPPPPPPPVVHAVEIFFDGAWCQVTTGQGRDNVSVSAAVTIIPSAQKGGFFNPADTVVHSYNLGSYDDRGGSGQQEMRKITLAGLYLSPGENAEVMVAMYGDSSGGFFDHIGKVFLKLGPGMVGGVVAIFGGGPVTAATASKATDKIIDAVTDAFKSADPGNYVGDARIEITSDMNGVVTSKYLAGSNEKSGHVPKKNGAGSTTYWLKANRAEYWPKLNVIVH